MIKAMIVDDDLPSIRVVEHFIGAYPEVELVGSFTDPAEALRHLDSCAPNIVFLDIRMGALSGMDMAKSSPPTPIRTSYYHGVRQLRRRSEVNAMDASSNPSWRALT